MVPGFFCSSPVRTVEWLPSQESNPPYGRLTAGRVHLARLMGIAFLLGTQPACAKAAARQPPPETARQAEAAEQRRLVENPGVEPGAPILQGSAAARCLPRARSWFRATLSAFSARRFHQISLPGELVRMPVIETGPDEWRSSARPSSYTRRSSLRKIRPGFPKHATSQMRIGGNWTESNLLPEGTAFTAQRRHQPVLTCTSRSFSVWSQGSESNRS